MRSLRRFLPLALSAAALWGCDDEGGASQDPLSLDQGAATDAAAADAAETDSAVDLGPMADLGAGGAGGEGGQGGAGGEGGQGGAGGGAMPADCQITVPTTVESHYVGRVEIPNGRSPEFTVELPEDVISLTVLAVEPEDSAFIGIGKLEGPEGQVLISENPPGGVDPIAQFAAVFPGPFSSPNRMAVAASGVGGALAPNNPEVAVSPGTWTLQLLAGNARSGRPQTSSADVTVHIKRAAGDPTCGQLNLHLYFSGAEGWTAATAPDDARFQAALARMAEFYHEIGIGLGDITYDDVETPLTVDATGGPGSDLHALYSACAYDDGVCLFFVERLSSPLDGRGGGGVGGVAGGTPGPNLMPGTVRSGVAVATTIADDPDALGHVMGHETGHYLGLYHTREFIGINDQIPDTDAGEDNLMFPTVTSAPARLSPGQGFVLHRNAAVYTPEAK